ncbi:hypothetical protein [Bacillus wiedmannii]|uniref:hypothetical protein n=1 Tax=Bacillus wiedmannii TaxID=1890302 RepID=UPI00159BB656|nr:hypothetical protein [Bacillus wiedmannii]MEE3946192.1 hypothetical protein [Bacillus wiedmannii]
MCEHKYQLLDSETQTFFADGCPVAINISATFFCEKCLDIQHKETRLHVGDTDEGV